MSFDFINSHLQARQQSALNRKRYVIEQASAREIIVDNKRYLNFASNDYLGFADEPTLLEGLQSLGSHSSALVTGYQGAQQQLEKYLCAQLGYNNAMLFNSGFSANSSVIKALFQDKTIAQQSAIFQDKLNHASLIDGALHANAALVRFNHNDMNHLRSRLEKSNAKYKLIVSEGVFSMDGDQAPLIELLSLAKAHNAWLMIDDAHGFGVLGKSGLGSCEPLIAADNLPDILVITFGKTVASSGACVLGSSEFIDYMLQFNRDYTYSTAMSPFIASHTLSRIKTIRDANHKRAKLNANIALFRRLANEQKIALMDSTTAIQPLVLGCAEQTLKAGEQLKQQGIWLTAIRPPTVQHNTSRLRITLTAAHTEQDITTLVNCLKKAIA
ncbi:aminotransferase class I/II-fold pyridoxal phosphate-dependent enzyme [Pseudoalteromonas sp.]|uniref:aminotransferase class I/II-fold pyridoxal phosphate-dependent enzyme n=1 Tax=Pseudoalteromonas sp. TaxID=53249 RepID=UPI00356161E1